LIFERFPVFLDLELFADIDFLKELFKKIQTLVSILSLNYRFEWCKVFIKEIQTVFYSNILSKYIEKVGKDLKIDNKEI
jgi:hypothetical protein